MPRHNNQKVTQNLNAPNDADCQVPTINSHQRAAATAASARRRRRNTITKSTYPGPAVRQRTTSTGNHQLPSARRRCRRHRIIITTSTYPGPAVRPPTYPGPAVRQTTSSTGPASSSGAATPRSKLTRTAGHVADLTTPVTAA